MPVMTEYEQFLSQRFIPTEGLLKRGLGVSRVSRFSDASGGEFEYEEPVFEVIPRLGATSYGTDSRNEVKRVTHSDLLPCCHFYFDANDFVENSDSENSESGYSEHRAVWKVSRRKDIADIISDSSKDHVSEMINWSSSIIVHSPDLLLTLIEEEDKILTEYPAYFAECAKEWSQHGKDMYRIEALDVIFEVPGIIPHLAEATGTIAFVIKSFKLAPKIYGILHEYGKFMKDILSPKKWSWKKLIERGFIDKEIGLLKIGDELIAKESPYYLPEYGKIKICNPKGHFKIVEYPQFPYPAEEEYKSPTEAARNFVEMKWHQRPSLNGFMFWNTENYGTLDEARNKFIEAGKFRTII